ncbi:hypothetical protein ASC58_14085 [Phycicoccus sp. Root101]|nr:hypothetical protein ASC58_14085 [Phycicoccus sp. Root101]
MVDMTDLGAASQLHTEATPAPATELDGLLSRSALGDATAFGDLYDRTAARFYHLALTVLGDHGRAEETTLAAYAQIWATARDFDTLQHRSLSWMTTIVYDLARSARGPRAA